MRSLVGRGGSFGMSSTVGIPKVIMKMVGNCMVINVHNYCLHYHNCDYFDDYRIVVWSLKVINPPPQFNTEPDCGEIDCFERVDKTIDRVSSSTSFKSSICCNLIRVCYFSSRSLSNVDYFVEVMGYKLVTGAYSCCNLFDFEDYSHYYYHQYYCYFCHTCTAHNCYS